MGVQHKLIAKRFVLALVLLAGFAGATDVFSRLPENFSRLPGKWFAVKWVVDGDTILLENGVSLRYIGINAPETAHNGKNAQPLGALAAKANKRMVHKKMVRIFQDKAKTDHYGRTLAYVFLADKTFVNKEMVLKGLAWCLYSPPNTRFFHEFLLCQRKAIKDKAGLWANWKPKKALYVGNSHTKRFHLPGCKAAKKISFKNRIAFNTMQDAFWQGYAPCRKCLNNWWDYK